MKLIAPLLLTISAWPMLCFSQYEKDAAFLYLGPSDITIGSINGIHPNLFNDGFGAYLNGDLSQRFRVKNVPFHFVGHLSNEELRIGKPSYLRLSYDASVASRLSNLDLGVEQFKMDDLFNKFQSDLYELEGKLAYKREMQKRLLAKLNFDQKIPEIPIIKLDSLGNPLPDISFEDSNIDLPEVGDIEAGKLSQSPKLDSLMSSIEDLATQISTKKSELDSLKTKVEDLEQMNLSSYVPQKLLIKRANFGLTSLSSGGLSNNAIPIHGFHVEGEYRKTFYDISAGLTQPFQNFTSEVFSQITSNTQNVFNLDQFYQADRMRFVESSIIGYGDKYKSNIKLEQFYTGKSLEAIKSRTQERIANTINVSGNYNNELIKNLELGFLAGISVISKDSIEHKTDVSSLAYRGTVKYKLEKLNGKLESEYRNLGGNYDGASQGVLINGTSHKMLGYTQKIGRSSSASFRYMEDSFSKTDSIVLFNSSKRLMSQASVRINRHNRLQGSYSMIIGSGTEIENRKGHMGTLFYVNEIKIGKNRLTNIAQGGYTIIPIRLSNQEIIQGSIGSNYETEMFSYSLKGTYEEYRGIEQLYGRNYIIEPSIGIKGKMGEISATYQYCKSEQFSEDHGLLFKAKFSPSQYLTWQVTGQKWLEKERSFFFNQAPSFVAPWYVDVRLIVHLNVKK